MALQQIEIPVRGMDCTDCCNHVQRALTALPGVQQANVLLAAEKAIVQYDAAQVDVPSLHRAVEGAGYSVPVSAATGAGDTDAAAKLAATGSSFTRSVLAFTGLVAGIILLVVVAGEWLGLFEAVTERIPWTIGWLIVLTGWYPILRNVVRAALRREIISHTLMSVGVIAALAVGQWTTAAIVVLFMRVGDYVEGFTSERARRAVKDLTQLAPQTARIERDGIEEEVAIEAVAIDDTVVVRPGEQIPVDGMVIAGQATVNQATITGESLPVEVAAGSTVFAATIAQLGHLRIRVSRVGSDTTFGRVIKLVEEAESHRADVQRIADRFSTYFLPVVAAIAALTFLVSRNPLATAAVLVVACSCSFALATPIAMLASIGAGAKRGLLIKGGKYLELLAKADVLLLDKTGTLTLGKPQITDVVALNGKSEAEILVLAAAAEHYSEHPLAAAVREAGHMRGLSSPLPDSFVALPGLGIRAQVGDSTIAVGSNRLLSNPVEASAVEARIEPLIQQGKSLLYVLENEMPIGVLAAADTVRPEVPEAIRALEQLGIQRIELLTGDHERTAATLAAQIGIAYQANLLPEDKVAIVKQYQSQGHTVVMVGDGVNDAPALAQADVGIAMGAAGTDIALEAAHIALMRDDWRLVPEAFTIARRTLRIVKMNFAFTALYNTFGLLLAAFGILPPVLAAVAQSIPDLGILANSSRLLRQGNER
jgi:P-type Cu+ transporter